MTEGFDPGDWATVFGFDDLPGLFAPFQGRRTLITAQVGDEGIPRFYIGGRLDRCSLREHEGTRLAEVWLGETAVAVTEHDFIAAVRDGLGDLAIVVLGANLAFAFPTTGTPDVLGALRGPSDGR